MAEILASALVSTLLENLNSTALQGIGLAWGLEGELKTLGSRLTTVQRVLQDAEKKQRKNEVLQHWLLKLKHAAYDAENILDRIAIEDFKRRKGTRHPLKSYFSRQNPLLFRIRIASKVRVVRKRLDVIAKERSDFHLTEGVMDNRVGGKVESRETSSHVNELGIVGRKEEKEKIIEMLLGNTRDDKLSVYAIWGMGGLGKTTLAQLVYNDERTERHFDMRMWVCVSDDFGIQKILRAIIESIDQGECNISALDPLQRHLQEKLRGKRFFLVLDDVWNESDRLWDGLKEVLSCGSSGSVLMVTTRIEKVAHMMATIRIHRLGYLSEADSWSLFRQRAFASGEKDEDLIEIGKAIVQKCGGVPLAVKSLGSLMQFKSSEREWLAIKESEIWLLHEDENGILPALRLSYDNLPPQLKSCFAYCCIFPKDYVMNEDRLIQLWMANGFIPSEGQTDLYLTGHLMFKELVWRSFFQDVNGKTCKMHDLMHDLAQSVMKHETCIVESDCKAWEIPEMLNHLSLNYTKIRGPDKVKLPLIPPNSLRSFITYEHVRYFLPYEEEDLSAFLSKQKYLRVLDIPPYNQFSNLLCKLEHLRYLEMSCLHENCLPESLTCLHYLQTLKLRDSWDLLELPKGLKHMKNLRFLEIESHDSLLCMPSGVGELTLLQALSIFIVGLDSATQIDQLKELNLGGELSIRGLESVRNFKDAESANLIRKKNLTSLSLSWAESSKGNGVENCEEVLEGLQPCRNLKKLSIGFYQGSRFPNWMSTSACKNLTEISLECCHRCDRLPSLGKLSSLTYLKLSQMDSIKHLDAEWHGNGETTFPALMDLTIEGMPHLEKWTVPDSGESFPCLKWLKIRRCPKLNGLPKVEWIALRDLVIEDSSLTLLRSIMFLTSLTKIYLLNFAELDVLPELPEGLKHLRSLEELCISQCENLTSFPATILQDLSSLRTLRIYDCKRLKPLSGPLHRESALEDLLIYKCPEFKYLLESMQKLTALKFLDIMDCEEIRSLPNWLGRLQSLTRFQISGTLYLNSLPDGFQNLKSLRMLLILQCNPELVKRCKKPEGQDWPKISHIPCVLIGGRTIQDFDL